MNSSPKSPSPALDDQPEPLLVGKAGLPYRPPACSGSLRAMDGLDGGRRSPAPALAGASSEATRIRVQAVIGGAVSSAPEDQDSVRMLQS